MSKAAVISSANTTPRMIGGSYKPPEVLKEVETYGPVRNSTGAGMVGMDYNPRVNLSTAPLITLQGRVSSSMKGEERTYAVGGQTRVASERTYAVGDELEFDSDCAAAAEEEVERTFRTGKPEVDSDSSDDEVIRGTRRVERTFRTGKPEVNRDCDDIVRGTRRVERTFRTGKPEVDSNSSDDEIVRGAGGTRRVERTFNTGKPKVDRDCDDEIIRTRRTERTYNTGKPKVDRDCDDEIIRTRRTERTYNTGKPKVDRDCDDEVIRTRRTERTFNTGKPKVDRDCDDEVIRTRRVERTYNTGKPKVDRDCDDEIIRTRKTERTFDTGKPEVNRNCDDEIIRGAGAKKDRIVTLQTGKLSDCQPERFKTLKTSQVSFRTDKKVNTFNIDGDIAVGFSTELEAEEVIDVLEIGEYLIKLLAEGKVKITTQTTSWSATSTVPIERIVSLDGLLYALSGGNLYVLVSQSFEANVWIWTLVTLASMPSNIHDISTCLSNDFMWISSSEGGFLLSDSKVRKMTDSQDSRRFSYTIDFFLSFDRRGNALLVKGGEILCKLVNIRDACISTDGTELHVVEFKHSYKGVRIVSSGAYFF